MLLEITIRKVGRSLGIELPKEALAHLNVGEGDTVCITKAADGSLRMIPTNPEFARQIEHADAIVRRYRNAMRDIAK